VGQVAEQPPSTAVDTVADVVMLGGALAGILALIVGGSMGQHRLWTKEIRRNGLRRNRRRHS
jgi:hypothetical protein